MHRSMFCLTLLDVAELILLPSLNTNQPQGGRHLWHLLAASMCPVLLQTCALRNWRWKCSKLWK